MKTFKSILCASLLAVALSANAFAGIISVPKATPSQPESSKAGIIVVMIAQAIAGIISVP
jgi:hypothetical protein